MSLFEEELEQFDDEWDETEVRTGGAILAEGVYQAKITTARVERSDWDTLQWALTFEDLGGKGFVSTWCNLEEEIGRSIAKTYATQLGYEGKLSKLPAACASGTFEDLVVQIKVKDKHKDNKVYKIVYINKLLGKNAGVEGNDFDGDDDLPF